MAIGDLRNSLTAAVAGAAAFASEASEAALDLLLPRACVICDATLSAAENKVICNLCLSRIVRLPAPACSRCGHPRRVGECTWCSVLPPFVRAVRSVAWVPGGVAGDIMHKLKYDGWTALAEPAGELMSRLPFPRDVVEERALVVPVPLAQSRLRERGYNQSELLARVVAGHWRVPVAPAVGRLRPTESQTRLTPGDRLRNVAGAFGATAPKGELAGRHVVLVDDVATTAATLNACAAALHAGGARIISYVTFGRARAPGDVPS